MKWELLSSEYLYRDSWFTARKDRCRTPDGRIVDPYYVLEYPDWANALALTEDGEVLLVRQYRHALGKTLLELPGGVVEAGDPSPMEAIGRELAEETGYTFRDIESLGSIAPNPSTQTNMSHGFLALGGRRTREQVLDPNEEIEVVRVSMEELKGLLNRHEILQALHVSTLYYGLLRLGELKLI